MKHQGFTIIELLIVIAIIGILVAIGLPNILRSREVTRIREIQADIVRDLEKAKYLTRRHSYSYNLTFSSTGYSFAPTSSGTIGVEAITISRTLPSDVEFMSVPTTQTLNAPFGRLGGASNASGGTTLTDAWIRLRMKTNTTVRTAIDMVGVTGIVVRRGIF